MTPQPPHRNRRKPDASGDEATADASPGAMPSHLDEPTPEPVSAPTNPAAPSSVPEEVIAAAPSRWRPVVALALMALALTGFFALGLDSYARPDALRDYEESLRSWSDAHGALAALTFMAVFIVCAVACLPVIAFLAMAAGFLFGPLAGSLYAFSAGTTASLLSYLGARYAFRQAAVRRGGAMLSRLESAFARNEILALVLIRLIPVIPYWTANMLPAVLGVRFRKFALGTAIGLLPGALILAYIGHRIAEMVAEGVEDEIKAAGVPGAVILAAAALLVVSPRIWRAVSRYRRRQAAGLGRD